MIEGLAWIAPFEGQASAKLLRPEQQNIPMRYTRVILACFAAFIALPVPFGCGSHSDGTVVESVEAKQADQSSQKGMEEYMKSQGGKMKVRQSR